MTLKPYYEDDHVTLYHADCLQHLDLLDQADVLVTDPPYGVAYGGFGGRKGEPRRHAGRLTIAGDKDTASRDVIIENWGTKPALIFGKWTVERPAGTKERLIWDKRPCGFMGDTKSPWGGTDEEIYVLGTGFVGKRGSNILNVPTLMSGDSRRPDHPTPKPVPLMERLLGNCPPEWVIIDPFAGGPTRGVIAHSLGRDYFGIDLMADQVEYNHTHHPGPDWQCGGALTTLRTKPSESFDSALTCPPYWDLERYSDDPRDLSTMGKEDFLDTHAQIITETARVLKQDSFAVWVIGDKRDKHGHLAGLPWHTIQAFHDAGMPLINDHILVTPVGSKFWTMGRTFRATRTATRLHQYVLVFVKGDRRKATTKITGGDNADPQ